MFLHPWINQQKTLRRDINILGDGLMHIFLNKNIESTYLLIMVIS
jgi:hypothetical protein